jgi:hypothetical protein
MAMLGLLSILPNVEDKGFRMWKLFDGVSHCAAKKDSVQLGTFKTMVQRPVITTTMIATGLLGLWLVWRGPKLSTWLNSHSLEILVVTYPFQCAVYLLSNTLLVIILIYCFYRQQYKHAFWCVIALILTDFVFSSGDDTVHHDYRILGLSEQIRHGHLSLLLTNPTTGESFPVFVYYSFLPYVLPVVLSLVGIPALLAFKIAMGLPLIVLGAGLQGLISRTLIQQKGEVSSGFLIAILFVSANYVCGLWCTRAALGEIWAYSLIPVVVMCALSPQSHRPLAALFFIQICVHPLVLPQSLLCELGAAYVLSREPPLLMMRRCIAPLAVALLFATPFWLPQFLWLHDIVGNAVLPTQISDTFLSVEQLGDPTSWKNIGLWIPGAAVLMILASRARLPSRVWVMILAVVALAALQTVYLRSLVIHVPILDQSQFIWRLMLPMAFMAFAVLLEGWRTVDRSMQWGLVLLAFLSAIWMVLNNVPCFIRYLWVPKFDEAGYARYLRSEDLWGVGLFAPDYSRLPQNCGPVERNETETVTFDALRTGVTATRPFVLVRNGPVGFVKYYADKAEISGNACYDTLLLGPIKPNQRVWVAEDRLRDLLMARTVALIAGLVIIFVVPIPFRNLLGWLPGHTG